jgi:IS30 family transposase
MASGRSWRLTPDERRELWRRWLEGQTLTAIGEALSLAPASVFAMVRSAGGLSPPDRTRSERSLTREDREEITRGLAAGDSLREIASRIGRSPSTVSREVSRNGGRGRYRAGDSDDAAWCRARRPKACLLSQRPTMRATVAQKLSEDWSPQPISGWLREEFPDDARMQVSHETIYRSLFVQARGVLRKELMHHLRSGRIFRRSRHATTKSQGRGGIRDAVSIRERPAEAEDRAVPGHWEGDLLAGSGNTHIATLVECKSRFAILVKVDSKDTQTVVKALQRRARTLQRQLKRTLTWDRGSEMASHRDFTVATDVKVYFCDWVGARFPETPIWES